MTLGEHLKQLRQSKELTQRQLAESAGVDFTYLSKIENDRLEHSPSLKTLQSLAEALNTDELVLLELADKMPPVLRDIAHNREALQFLRKASRMVKTRGDWQRLSKQLDDIEHGSGDPED